MEVLINRGFNKLGVVCYVIGVLILVGIIIFEATVNKPLTTSEELDKLNAVATQQLKIKEQALQASINDANRFFEALNKANNDNCVVVKTDTQKHTQISRCGKTTVVLDLKTNTVTYFDENNRML